MIDLFYPPSIKPRATRIVMLSGEPEPGAVRPYVPRAHKASATKPDPGAFIGPPTREGMKRMLIRIRQAEWLRNKRRNDPGWRERENAIERERYAKASKEQREARLAQMMEYKLNRRP